MRVAVGKTLRVGPGDHVVIRGQLPPDGKLGRLFVFASENGGEFSPYVLNVAHMIVVDGRPSILSPLTMRLVEARPSRELSFVTDIDGYLRVMQEIDDPSDPRVRIRMTRKINPNLGWVERLQRRIASWQMTPTLS